MALSLYPRAQPSFQEPLKLNPLSKGKPQLPVAIFPQILGDSLPGKV